jgi:hypothetical protein
VVRPEEVNYFKRECFSAVVARVFEGDRQGDSFVGDRLLAQNHSVKWVHATLELVLGEPQSLEGAEVHEVDAAVPIHEGLSEPGCSAGGSTIRGNLPGLGMISGWSIRSKVLGDSDQHRYSGTTALTTLISWPVSLSLRWDSWGPVRCKLT